MSEPKTEFFEVASRMRLPEYAWQDWIVIGKDLSPREAKGLVVRHSATLVETGWEVVSLDRTAGITLETPQGTRIVVRMRKIWEA